MLLKAWARAGRRLELLYLHGDVGYGGRGQVKVLLDQDVEFGGQVASRANAVDLAGEQGRDLGHKKVQVRSDWGPIPSVRV